MTFESIQELEKVLAVAYHKVSKYHRLYQKAASRATRYARTRDNLVRDKIFLKRKIWAILAVLPSDANWHNAPDYICHFKSQMSAHAKQANHYQKLYEELKAQRKNSMSIENVQQMMLDFANSRVAHTNYSSDIDHRNDVFKFFEEWRQNNDC